MPGLPVRKTSLEVSGQWPVCGGVASPTEDPLIKKLISFNAYVKKKTVAKFENISIALEMPLLLKGEPESRLPTSFVDAIICFQGWQLDLTSQWQGPHSGIEDCG